MIPNLIAGLLGSGVAAVGDYESIQTVTVGAGGSASISFTSIPSTYTHLQIRYLVKTSVNVDLNMQFNGSGSSYYAHILRGFGDTTSSSAYAISAISNIGTAGFTAGITDVLDYTSTNKNKTSRTLSGADYNGSGNVGLWSHLWFATPAAVSSIAITPASGTISQYSQFALYGVK